MMPTARLQRTRIATCLADLSDNGINLAAADDRELRRVVRKHLEYFQLMLGFDSDAAEVLQLIRDRKGEPKHKEN